MRKRKASDERINKIAMNATINNPVSVLNLSKVADFVGHCLALGASDDDAETATRKFIQQIEGNPVE